MLERLGWDEGPRGSVVLRKRSDEDGVAYELIVNGAFVMDTRDTSTEVLLATAALDRIASPRRILVGGLGLGFTVRALLADPRVAADTAIEVVELEPALVSWIRSGLVPATASVLSDPRVSVRVADVRHVLPAYDAGALDAVLLDVDNGPDFLVHIANAEVYRSSFLETCADALAPGGVLAVWSASRSPALAGELGKVFGDCEEIHRLVRREDRILDYYLYLARR